MGVGLSNMGATCYVNAVVQALRLAPPLACRTLQRLSAPTATGADAPTPDAWEALARSMWAHDGGGGSIAPRAMLMHMLGRRLIEPPGRQGDAPQFAEALLDALHEGSAQPVHMRVEGAPRSDEDAAQLRALAAWAAHFGRAYSHLVPAVFGQTRTVTRCAACGSSSERFQPWSVLHVPLPGADRPGGGAPIPSPAACLAAAFEGAQLDDYVCDAGCGGARGAAAQSNAATLLPPVLILSMKRFTNAGHKVRGAVPWDLELVDLGAQAAFEAQRPDARYMVYAVVEHLGTASAGHYVAYARSAAAAADGAAAWLRLDDGAVTPVPPEHAGAIVSDDSYMLFLCRRREWDALRGEVAPLLWRLLQPVGRLAAEAAARERAADAAAAPPGPEPAHGVP
jgi:ubiquitin carboxyl-terminal hydrolase 8